jgi:hypothetical protein
MTPADPIAERLAKVSVGIDDPVYLVLDPDDDRAAAIVQTLDASEGVYRIARWRWPGDSDAEDAPVLLLTAVERYEAIALVTAVDPVRGADLARARRPGQEDVIMFVNAALKVPFFDVVN